MILKNFEILKVFIENQDKYFAGIYLICAKIIASIAFLPGTPLTLLSGVVLGTFWGSIVSIIGNVIGAMLAFLIARYFLKDFVQNRILKKYPKINEYEGKLFKNGLITVIFLRLVPLFPFNVLNFALAVTEVKFKDYFLGTLIGVIPGTVAFVYLGESLAMFSTYNIILATLGIVGLIYVGKTLEKKK